MLAFPSQPSWSIALRRQIGSERPGPVRPAVGDAAREASSFKGGKLLPLCYRPTTACAHSATSWSVLFGGLSRNALLPDRPERPSIYSRWRVSASPRALLSGLSQRL